jgi:hypothetical protein
MMARQDQRRSVPGPDRMSEQRAGRLGVVLERAGIAWRIQKASYLVCGSRRAADNTEVAEALCLCLGLCLYSKL